MKFADDVCSEVKGDYRAEGGLLKTGHTLDDITAATRAIRTASDEVTKF